MKFKVLTVTFAVMVMALSTVTASAESVKSGEESYASNLLNGNTVASVSATVTYNRFNKITPYTQITSSGCATTCAGMCVGKSPNEHQNDGFNLNWADWEGIGRKYGYTVDWLGRTDLSGKDALKVVFDYLKAGYPVCVWINQTNPHWVVIYSYSGDGVNFNASDFMCVDPARCWSTTSRLRRLDLAYNYDGVYNTVVFK